MTSAHGVRIVISKKRSQYEIPADDSRPHGKFIKTHVLFHILQGQKILNLMILT
jgi:hypothetical protein